MQKPYDVAIIGAGIAGMTAAIYAARANKSVVVFEGKTYGGQIITSEKIANYPALPGVSGVELSKKIYQQMSDLGIKIKYLNVTEIHDDEENWKEIVTDEYDGSFCAGEKWDQELGVYTAKTVILAVGSIERELDLPGEKEFLGKGLSYCATCDGGFFKNKPVAVIGGGNTALYDALYLADVASKVYLVHRRNEFRGDQGLVDKVREKKNVEFVMESRPNKLLGDKKLEGVEVRNEDGKKRTLEVDGLFVAIGRVPATKQFEDLVKLDEDGYIKAGEDCHTSRTGVFVAGDCRTKSLRQLVTASSDGAMAATEAIKFLK